MNSLPFVALDLETTGLNPHTDTIIEIAAIRGEIINIDGKYRVINTEERTMLVNPGKPLEEEVVLITKITDSMLADRASWYEIKQKVQEFIGENRVIIGHNVLFDVAMLETHGIDLTKNNILDTFELSEIFSQDAESLNLGFLWDFYKIPKRGQEHRALTDTWISVDLLCHYLQNLENLNENQKNIWNRYALQNPSPIAFLKDFCEVKHPSNTDKFESWKQNFSISQVDTKNSEYPLIEKHDETEIFSLENNKISEVAFIKTNLEKYKKLRIVTRNKKISQHLRTTLQKENITATILSQKWDFITGEIIFHELENLENSTRKYFIFLLKMVFWLEKTHTGLQNELKYYGEEYKFLENFRLQENETSLFIKNQEANGEKSEIIIETFSKNTKKSNIKTLFKDISLFEECIRKNTIESIYFDELVENIWKIPNQLTHDFINAVRTTEGLYENLVDRPTGENPIPPGKYGETYFFSQDAFWHKGCKWLMITNRLLFENFSLWKEETSNLKNRAQKIIRKKILSQISLLLKFQTQKHENLGIILNIIHGKNSIQFIERNLTEKQKALFANEISYGFHLTSDGMSDFLTQEFNLPKITENTEQDLAQIIQFQNTKKIKLTGKTLILTTSMKHIREIGGKLENIVDTVLLQGTSGGKSKMTHYFLEENNKNTVLVGLIDSWSDEKNIFEKIDRVIIAKIPFDPPTDPHFLAKTQGMKNSFELYSKPIVLSRLNTLIGNVIYQNKNIEIFCSDERIQTTEWGKFLQKNLF